MTLPEEYRRCQVCGAWMDGGCCPPPEPDEATDGQDDAEGEGEDITWF